MMLSIVDRLKYITHNLIKYRKFMLFFYYSIDHEFYVVESNGRLYENGSWDGLMAELVNRYPKLQPEILNMYSLIVKCLFRRADIGIGPIKTSSFREFSIDFSMYYHDMSGHTIVMKKTKPPSSMFQFLTVLDNTVWFCVLGLFFFVSMQLWMTDRHN